MSTQAMTWVWEDAPDVPSDLVSLLAGLANHADREGRNAWPSAETLTDYTRKGERQVRRGLAKLEELGLIRRGDQRVVMHIRPDRRPVVWDLALERKRTRRDLTDDLGSIPVDNTASGVSPATGRTPENGVSPTTGRDSRGVVEDRHGVSPTTERGVVDDTQTVLEPSTEPRERASDDDAATSPSRPPVDNAPPPLPPSTCPEHRHQPATGPCPPCGDARRTRHAAEDELAVRRRDRDRAERAAATRAAELRAAERGGCQLCDDDGTAYVDGVSTRCTHDDGRNRRLVAARQASRTGWRQHRAQEA